MKFLFFSFFFFFVFLANAQQGKNGAANFTSGSVKVNEFTTLLSDATAGDTILNVTLNTLNANSRFTSVLGVGDLILIIQMQGATINTVPADSTWGEILAYNNSGKNEIAEVKSVSGSNSIKLSCALMNNYSASGKTQIVRIPRYSSLNLATCTLTTDTWDGSKGGVLAVEVQGNSTINAGGVIDVSGLGFRGGNRNSNQALCCWTLVYVATANDNAEKGESIAGSQTDYDSNGGRYSRGAPANGGGGGNTWNAAGGGGGNAGLGIWTGQGNPASGSTSGNAWSTAWDLEWSGFSSTTSSGGGRGGYGWSSKSANPYTKRPGDAAWKSAAGDVSGRQNIGGIGGRPMDYTSGRLFLGGGGGGGNQDNTLGTSGKNGSGLVYFLSYGTISGSGTINANGASQTTAAGKDGSGGGGAGGTVVIKSSGAISGITVSANGGTGGSQNLASAIEAEGPGGGGGGGYIAISNGAITRTATGGANGTTNSSALSPLFAPNGATKGGDGVSTAATDYFKLEPANVTICSGDNATLKANSSGTAPSGASFDWYDAQVGGNLVGSGDSIILNNVSSQTIRWFTVCPGGTYRVADTVLISPAVNVNAGNDTSICVGASAFLAASGADTYSWYPASGLDNATIYNPTATLTSVSKYYVVGENTIGCIGLDSVSISIITMPVLDISGDTTLCNASSSILTASGASSYTWSPATGLDVTTGITVTTSPSSNTLYTLSGTDSACTSIKYFNVTVADPIITQFTPLSSSICVGDSVQISISGADTYTWSPSATLSNSTGATVYAKPLVTTNYTISREVNGCTSDTIITVTVIDLPIVLVAPEHPVLCSGDDVVLAASGATTYSWISDVSLSVVNATDANASPSTTTIYTVIGTQNGCENSDTVEVIVENSINVFVTATDDTVCVNGSIILTAANATTYSWTSSTELDVLTGATVTASPTANAIYTVTGTSGTCSDTGMISIKVNDVTVAATNNGEAVCEGQTINIDASGANTYNWASTSTYTNVDANTIQASPSSGTNIYTLTGIIGSCSDTAMVSITGKNLPTVTTTPIHPVICNGSSVPISASGATTYSWVPDATLAIINATDVTVSPTADAIYTVIGTLNGCTNTDTVEVAVASSIDVAISSSDDSVCVGGSIILTAANATTYSWTSSTELDVLTGATVTASPTANAIFTVTGTSGTCSDTGMISIIINNVTVAATNNGEAVCEGQTINIDASGANTYNWASASTFTTVDANTIQASPSSGTNIYTLTGIIGSCSDTAMISISTSPAFSFGFSLSNDTVCEQAMINASVLSSLTTVSWSPITYLSTSAGSSTSITPIVGAASTLTYTINASNGSCTQDTTFTVNVSPHLTVGSTLANDTLCLGNAMNVTANGAATYSWTNSSDINNLSATNVIITPSLLGANNYTVIGYNNYCSDSSFVKITAVQSQLSVAQSILNLCTGDSVQVNATNANTYTWTPATNITATNIPNPFVYPSAGTVIYTVEGTDNYCTDTAMVSVTVTPTIPISLSDTSITICQGASATITASSPGSTFTWSPATYLSVVNTDSIVITPTTGAPASLVYSLTVNNGSCTSDTSITAYFQAQLAVSISASKDTVCLGVSTSLTASGATSYSWISNANLTGSIGASNSATAAISGSAIYTVIGTSGTCSDTASISIETVTSQLAVSPLTTSVCNGDSTQLTASNANTYSWLPADGLSATTGSSVYVQPSSGTVNYSVIGMDDYCTDTAFASVSVISNIPITFANVTFKVCEETQLTISASSPATQYSWSPSTYLNSTSDSIIIVAPIAGAPTSIAYTLTVTQGSCSNDTIITVVINKSPDVSFQYSNDTLCLESVGSIMAQGADSYMWDMSNVFATVNDSTINIKPVSVGYNEYFLTSTKDGCEAKDTARVVGHQLDLTVTPTNAKICSGDTITIIASGADQYSWSPQLYKVSESAGTFVVNPTANILYTFFGSDNYCTDDTAQVQVEVVSNIVFNITSSLSTLCIGDVGNLTSNSNADNLIWSPATYLASPTGFTNAVTPTTGAPASITYTITGTIGTCTLDTTMLFNINAKPTVIANADKTTLCLGDVSNLTASGADSYAWSPVTDLNNNTGTGVVFTSSISGTNTIQVIGESNLCYDTAFVNITVNDIPTAAITPSKNPICEGESVTLNATGADTYSWMAFTDVNGQTAASVSSTPSGTSVEYSVVGTTNGCSDTAVFTLGIEAPIDVSLTPNYFEACKGTSVDFSASGASNYSWTPAAGLSASSGINVSHTIVAQATYTVTGYNTACSDTAMVTVKTIADINLSINASKAALCSGETATLTPVGAGTPTYSWVPDASLTFAAGDVASVTPSQNTTYSLIAFNGTCGDTATQLISVTPQITVSINANTTTICSGETLVLNASGASNFTWNGEAVTIVDSVSANASPTLSQVFTAIGNTNGCTAEATIAISVGELPKVKASDDVSIGQGSSTELTVTGAKTFEWTPASNLSCTSCALSTASPLETITYTVTGTDSTGCSATDAVTVTVDKNFVVFVPSAFSPNGNGENDVLYVRGRGIVEVNLKIYNRWGEKVFETSDLNEGWDGTRFGVPLNGAVFVYYLKGKFYSGESFKNKGDITLIR